MNKKVDEENGRGGAQNNGRFWKLWRFPRKKIWKSIGCVLSTSAFGIGGYRMWDNCPRISVKKRKRYLI